jgi:hypothetical protein
MNRRLISILFGCTVAALALLPQAASLRAEGGKLERRTWDFESDAVGKIPAGFTPAVGAWSVAPDGKNHVLEQSARSDDSAFNLVLIDATNYADLELAVKLKSVGGKVDQGGGVVWRARDARNYYIARFNPLEDNFRVYKVVDGKRTQLETAKVTGGNAQWRVLKIAMHDSHIKCYLDDKLYLEADDSTFKGAGKIGLWCKSDANTYFDDLTADGRPAGDND